MTRPDDPNSWLDKILDHRMGEGTPAEREAMARRLEASPPAREARDALDGWFAAEARAHEVALDAAAPARVAARVLDRVRGEEERATRTARSRPLLVRWAWVLGAATAAHVVLLAVLGWARARDPGTSPDTGRGPDEVALHRVDRPEVESPSEGPRVPELAPYVLEDDRLALERARVLPDAAGDPLAPRLDLATTSFAPGAARAMALRTSDPAKRWIEARVGTSGSLDVAQRSLDALAAQQGPDGAFPPAASATAEATTGLVLLAFLGDGQSSRAGRHREVVARGLEWLRGRVGVQASSAGPYGLWALAEDFLLVNGSLTPAESRARAAELARVRDALVDAGGGPEEAWRSALAATARAGVATGPGATSPSARGALPVDAPGDVGADAWIGSAMLREGRAEEFRVWAAQSAPRLRARLAPDGLLRTSELDPAGGSSAGDRIAQTALLVVALQVPYRTL